ncbi:MAG: hypothetical protein ACRC5W_04175, partial [Cetobacterium sp.]
LLNLMKSFSENDFKEMYLEGKKRGLLKIVKDRDFSNVLTRLKLKLPLTIMSLEKLEVFYENLMKNIYTDKNSESNSNILKKIVENKPKEKLDIKEFDIESYTKNDWYRLYEISKEYKLKNHLQNNIFLIARYKESNLEVSNNHYALIRNHYSELYEVIKKFELEKNKSFEKNIMISKNSKIEEYINTLGSEEWYHLFEISKNNSKVEDMFRKYLLSLSKYKEKYIKLTNSQIVVIQNNYTILEELIQTMKNQNIKNVEFNSKLKKEENEKIILDQNIADILF